MRKKILTLIMVATMLATTLVGCGSDTSNENTIDETVNVESSEVVETVESGDASGTLGDIADEPIESETPTTEESSESEETLYGNSYYLTFPKGYTAISGYTDKSEYLEDVTMSYNETHYENLEKGFVIDFSWNGLSSVATKAVYEDDCLFLYDDANNMLLLYDTTDLNEVSWDSYTNITKEQWETIGYCNEYSGDEYFSKEIGEDIITVTFSVKYATSYGYGKHIVDKNNNKIYVFIYKELPETYDDARALEVINSITRLEQPLVSIDEIAE